MSHAVRLPHRQSLMVPAVALALGFAGATGAYVALDDGFLTDDSNSAAPAAAVTAPRVGISATGANEASTAAAVGRSYDTAKFLADRGITLRRSAPPSPGGSRP